MSGRIEISLGFATFSLLCLPEKISSVTGSRGGHGEYAGKAKYPDEQTCRNNEAASLESRNHWVRIDSEEQTKPWENNEANAFRLPHVEIRNVAPARMYWQSHRHRICIVYKLCTPFNVRRYSVEYLHESNQSWIL